MSSKKRLKTIGKPRENPIISYVMVTCHGGLTYTINAIKSMKEENTVPYELIVVDNGTSDGTMNWLKGNGISYVRTPRLVSYSEALNMGLRQASGEYLGIMNNDIIVTPNWETAILSIFKNQDKIKECDKIGIVGPMSNAVGYEQCISSKLLQDYGYCNDPKVIKAFGIEWFNKMWYSREPELANKCKRVGFLSGFCWIMSRECYNAVGKFNEELKPGGFEDNDYLKRAEEAGYAGYMCFPSIVHHEGGVSFESLNMSEARRGMANRRKFFDMHRTPKKQNKLVAGLRVKNVEKWFDKVLKKLSEVADEIVVLDDGSTDKTIEIAEKYKIFPLGNIGGKVKQILISNEETFNEVRDRELLWQECRKLNPDWILIIDGDEVLEPRLTREEFDKMMNPINPQIYSWFFRYVTLWDSDEKQRIDGTFNIRYGPRLVKNMPNYHITSDHPIGLHCGSVPEFPSFNTAFSRFRILHHGYKDKEDRHAKYEFYDTNDKVKNPRDVGAEDYSYLLDEAVQLIPFDPDLTLGLVTCIKDEMKPPFCHLERFLTLYYYLFDEIIMVDTGSTDNSIEVADYFGATIIEHRWNKDFAKARNVGLDNCTTKYVMHADPDEGFGKDAIRFRRWIEMPCVAYRIPIVHPKEGIPEPILTWKCRIFKNLKDIRYKDRVHEEVESAIKNIKGHGPILPILHNDKAPFQGITHYGFMKDNDFLTEKMNHYQELCKMMLEENPEHYYANYSVAINKATHGDDEEALKHFEVCMNSNPRWWKVYPMACAARVRQGIEILERGLQNIDNKSDEYYKMLEMAQELRKYGPKLPMIGHGN